MLTVGITGGIGSGKSYVSGVFEKIGIPVYNADKKARDITNTSKEVKSNIIELFGKKAYSSGQLNRQFIGSIVFKDKNLLEKLNGIIHPAVDLDFKAWCNKNSNYEYVLKEAAILFETGSYKKLDKTIAITAPENIRIQRVQNRDGSTAEDIRNRINNQWPAEKINALADFIIENESKKLILPQILEIDKKLRKEWRNLADG